MNISSRLPSFGSLIRLVGDLRKQQFFRVIFGDNSGAGISGGFFEFRVGHWALLFVVGILLCSLRRPAAFFYPDLIAEDGSIFFQDAYNLGLFRSLLEPYSGYFHSLSRILAWIGVVLVPLEFLPIGFALSSAAVASFCLSFFYSPCFRHILAHDGARFLLVLVLLLAPNADNLILLFGVHWYILFLSCVVFFAQPPRTWGSCLGFSAIGVLAAFSSPGFVLLLPFLLLRYWVATKPMEKIWMASWIVSLLAIVGMYLYETARKTSGGEHGLGILESLHGLLNAVSLSWLSTTLLGTHVLPMRVGNVDPAWSYAIALLVAGVVGVLLWGQRRRITKSIPALCWILLSIGMVGLLWLRPGFLQDFITFQAFGHDRYFTVPTLLLILSVGVLLHGLPQVNGSGTRRTALLGFLWLLAIFHYGSQAVMWNERPSSFAEVLPEIRHLESRVRDGLQGEYLRLGTSSFNVVIRRWGDRVVKPPHTPEEFFQELTVTAQDYRKSRWFGEFPVAEWPSLRHPIFGEIEAIRVAEGRYWFASREDGRMFWTGPAVYPGKFYEWMDAEGRWHFTDDVGRIWSLGTNGRWYTQDEQGRYWTVVEGNTWYWVPELP